MELEFDLTKEDYINFNINHLSISDVTKKRLFISRYIISLIFLIVPFILAKVTDISFWYWMITFSIVFIYYVTSYNKKLKKRVNKHINKLLGEENNKALIGKKILRISENGIEQISDVNTSTTKWEAIGKIIEYQEYIYIYNSAVSAYIIPTRVFKNDSEETGFVKLIKSYKNN
jgi:membrane protein implicated in regulation of membrane protease activity